MVRQPSAPASADDEHVCDRGALFLVKRFERCEPRSLGHTIAPHSCSALSCPTGPARPVPNVVVNLTIGKPFICLYGT
jgi:hypothetical protein